jgi:hypothetical protein
VAHSTNIRIDDVSKIIGTGAGSSVRSFASYLTFLNYGQTISISPSVTGTAAAANDRTFLSIHKVGSLNQPYAPRVAVIYNEQASGVGSGETWLAGATFTRIMNTDDGDQSFYTRSGNQITLDPGSYYLRGKAPIYRSDRTRLFWENLTDASTEIQGIGEFASQSGGGHVVATVEGPFTITSPKTFELQQYSQVAQGGGAGSPGLATSDGGPEKYGWIEITKIL